MRSGSIPATVPARKMNWDRTFFRVDEGLERDPIRCDHGTERIRQH